MPDTFSPVVSLYNLNQIYKNLDDKIQDLNSIYTPKGTCTYLQLKSQLNPAVGDVWSLTVSSSDPQADQHPELEDTNWMYISTLSASQDPNRAIAHNTSGWWVQVGSFLDIARSDKAGLIKIGYSSTNAAATAIPSTFAVQLDNQKAYVSIPKATTNTPGLVSADSTNQNFTGPKTFKDDVLFEQDVTVNGTLTVNDASSSSTIVTDLIKVEGETDITGDLVTGDMLVQAQDGTTGNLLWKPNTLNATQVILETDQITADSVTAGDINLGSGDISTSNKNISLSKATTDIEADIEATKITADQINLGTGDLSTSNNSISLSKATTDIKSDIEATKITVDQITLGTGDISTSNNNISLSKATTTIKSDIEATKITADQITLGTGDISTSNNSITLSKATTDIKSNIEATKITADQISLGTGDISTSNNSITLSKATTDINANLTATTISADQISLGTGTLSSSNHNITLGSNTTLTADTITVTNSISAQALTAPNGTIAVTGSDPTGGSAVTVSNTLTTGSLSTGSITSGTLTVTNGITATSLAKRTSDTGLDLTAASVSTGTLTLYDGSAYKTLTVKSDVTAASINAGATISNLTAIKADSLYLSSAGNSTTIDRALYVTSDTTVDTLSASNATATVGSTLAADTLDVSNGTLQVNGSGTSTVNVLNVQTAISSDTNTNLLTLGNSYTSGSAATFKELNNTSPARSTNTYRGQTALIVNGGGYFKGGVEAAKVFNAVWNDLSDRIEIDTLPEPGYAYALKDGHYSKTSKYMDQGYIGIESDTSGFEMGGKDVKYELNASVAGFVLAYVDKAYKPGTPLTVTKDGKLTKIKTLGRILHPEMVVATFWKPEFRETFGPEGAERQVNGRMWVKIK